MENVLFFVGADAPVLHQLARRFLVPMAVLRFELFAALFEPILFRTCRAISLIAGHDEWPGQYLPEILDHDLARRSMSVHGSTPSCR